MTDVSSTEPARGPIRLALDVMGSDNGVAGVVAGGLMAARDCGSLIEVTLVGREEDIVRALKKSPPPSNLFIHHAPHEILMTDSPSEAIRRQDTSVAVGLKLLKEKKVDAFVSPGNTGAVMAGSLLVLGRIHGVNRPAICALFPTKTLHTTLVLDVGANTTCKPSNIVQFAALGSAYSSAMYGAKRPKVGLLSIGEERSKGNELIAESYRLMERSNLNFVGNVEGRDILSGELDVVVTDGFTGNIVLKFAESIEPFLTTRIRHQVDTNIFSRVGAALMYPFLGRLRRDFDYAESGGAPLLGIEGVTMICHGASSPRAIQNGLMTARRMVETFALKKMRQQMKDNDLLHISAQERASGDQQSDSSQPLERARG